MKIPFVFAFLVVLHISFVCDARQSFFDWISFSPDGPAKVAENVRVVFTPDKNTVVFLPLKDLQFLPTHPRFNKQLPTVIYVHGWMESGTLDVSTLAIRGAYNDRGGHNVVCLDWSHYSKNVNYRTEVIPQMKVIAETMAEELRDMFNEGYPISLFHLVGHSLGGQMVGKISRHLKKITDGTMEVPRVYSLDPAGPGFENHNIDGFEPISKTDAKYVQIIHTCGGVAGMIHRVGHIDFFPNGGTHHPGCAVDAGSGVFGPVEYACDHYRSWHFYQASVRDEKVFPAIRCISYDDFLYNGTCYANDIVYMGFGADITATGKYYLQTRGNLFNLSAGMDGIRPLKYGVTRLNVPYNNYMPMSVPDEITEGEMF
ncbi:CLUMA_CG020953, isoform A [Clunio marinus]|uniref:CLUMA_CG020953, isoform A n=1 Tax=Clunio marinus TaxID=568069 RepID=A0A1J1J6D0_9DIPT|nr:CLUMA_CG020953, isoform A [Clunio marinus]